MVFTGNMSFYPNRHGILYFLDEITPLILSKTPDARLFVVGVYPLKELLRRASKEMTVTGFVEDVRPYVARAEVFIIPLLIDGGIRGKALEAMAMKKPIVSTSIGCGGINLKDKGPAFPADTPGYFAKAVLRLLNDEALRTKLGEKAYATVLEEYNWEAQGEKLERVYQTVVLSCVASRRG
jgi:glycosyltransferase involved in cell wall biosynthesis